MQKSFKLKRVAYVGAAMTLLLAALVLTGQSCNTKSTEVTTTLPANTAPAATTTTNEAVDTTDDVIENEDADDAAAAIDAEPGEVPFDFPAVATTASAGDLVLTPSRSWLDDAFAEGGDSTTFIFYDAEMTEPGAVESGVEDPFDSFTMPNSMIIPLTPGQTAEPGDVVLTWWQSGSGMQRAYVVEGGTPEQPMALYIDLDLDNPATTSDDVPIAEAEDELAVDSFHVLSGEFMPGSAIATLIEGDYVHSQVVSVSGDQILTIGFAGKMASVSKSDSVALPVIPSVVEGDAVQFPLFGTMTEGTVTKVDSDIGRVFVEYDWIGELTEVAVAFGDVIPSADLQ